MNFRLLQFFLLLTTLLASVEISVGQQNRDQTLIAIPYQEPKQTLPKRRFTRMTPLLAQQIVSTAREHGLDPFLILEVMRQESAFNQRARSYVGAAGLMQFMPGTARRFGLNDPYDPPQAIRAGCLYLKFLLAKFNNRVDLALAGYNAGEGAVIKYGYKVPPYRETVNYVATILTAYKRARAIAETRTSNAHRVKPKVLSTAERKKRMADLDKPISIGAH